ncbi:AAA family ATPase [Lactococcus garvieae]
MIESSGGSVSTENSIVYQLYCEHSSMSGKFNVHFSNESRGTQTFIILALYILQNHSENKVLLIDEFDNSFHQELAEILLDLFNNKVQNNQFILTTHELELMNHNLRPDQIWFAEKTSMGKQNYFPYMILMTLH